MYGSFRRRLESEKERVNAMQTLKNATLETEWHLLYLLVNESLLLALVDLLLDDTVILK